MGAFELYINQKILKKVSLFSVFYKSSTTTVFSNDIERNVSWAANHHIRMISEWSYDTEVWFSAENSALNHRNKKRLF